MRDLVSSECRLNYWPYFLDELGWAIELINPMWMIWLRLCWVLCGT